MPGPVASVVVGGSQVDMSVAQFGQHVGEHLEELFAGHAAIHLCLVFLMHLIPVKSVGIVLVVQEAVVLVDDLPQSLYVALGRVVELFLVHA